MFRNDGGLPRDLYSTCLFAQCSAYWDINERVKMRHEADLRQVLFPLCYNIRS
jgi:hypothetical protein